MRNDQMPRDPDEGFVGPAEPRPKPTRAHRRGGMVRTLLLAVTLFALARSVVLPFEVEGASMSPNLHNRERVLVNRAVYLHLDLNRVINLIPGVDRTGGWTVYPPFVTHPPRRGEIVVLNPPVAGATTPYIKRVIGLPGETVAFRDGYVLVDGERLDEPYIGGPVTGCRRSTFCEMGPIPAGYVYVLGDNRENSSDSRMFGPVRIDDIVGKAWFSNWPLADFGLLPSYEYPEA